MDFPYKINLFQVYKGHGWSLAEDHIHNTVGRQCFNRQQIEAACQALGALLKPVMCWMKQIKNTNKTIVK